MLKLPGRVGPGALAALVVSVLLSLSVAPTASLAQGPIFSDDFNDNAVNSSMWIAGSTGAGPTIAETTGQVLINFHSNSSNNPAAGFFGAAYGSICQLSGDFDMQVDFDLLTWPPANGVRVGLGTPMATMERTSFNGGDGFGTREVYVVDLRGGGGGLVITPGSTGDASGKLRLGRMGNTVTGYYYDPANSNPWVTLGSYSGPGMAADAQVALGSWSHDYAFADVNVAMAFDNFTVQQGRLVCPSPTAATLTSFEAGSSEGGWPVQAALGVGLAAVLAGGIGLTRKKGN